MTTFQAPILNASSSIEATGVGQEEMERRRLALQVALASCLSSDEMAHTVRLCEQEFAKKRSVSVSEFCQRLFETLPQVQLDKDARLRLLRAMRQPVTNLAADDVMPAPKRSESIELPEPIELSEPIKSSEPIPLSSPEDSTSPELFLVTETPPIVSSPEDSTSPELFVLRYANFDKEILG